MRNLLRNRRRTALTLLAVLMGVGVVVGVRGFLDGLQGLLIDGVVRGGFGALQVHTAGYADSLDAHSAKLRIKDVDAVVETIAKVEGVAGVSPRLVLPGLVSRGDETAFAVITAADSAREALVSPKRAAQVQSGTLAQRDSDITLGTELAALLGAHAGDTVGVLSPDVDGVLNAVEGGVSGTLAAQAQAEKRAVGISLSAGRALLRDEHAATEIAVAVSDLDAVNAVAARVQAAVGPGYEVQTWPVLMPFVRDARDTQNMLLRAVTAVFLIVTLLGVANTALMGMLERVREVGTLLSLGMKRKKVLQLFLIEGAFIGLLGALLGAALGAGIITAVAAHGIPLKPPGASVEALVIPVVRLPFLLQMTVLATIGSVLASAVPAWRASRMKPVEALATP